MVDLRGGKVNRGGSVIVSVISSRATVCNNRCWLWGNGRHHAIQKERHNHIHMGLPQSGLSPSSEKSDFLEIFFFC